MIYFTQTKLKTFIILKNKLSPSRIVLPSNNIPVILRYYPGGNNPIRDIFKISNGVNRLGQTNLQNRPTVFNLGLPNRPRPLIPYIKQNNALVSMEDINRWKRLNAPSNNAIAKLFIQKEKNDILTEKPYFKDALDQLDKHKVYDSLTSNILNMLNYEKEPVFNTCDAYYKVLKDNPAPMTVNEQVLNKQLKVFIKSKILEIEKKNLVTITRDIEEYQRLYKESSTPITESENAIRNYLSNASLSRCFVPDDYKSEIERNKEALSILEKYANNLTTPELMELVRRGGVIKNPNAIYKDDQHKTITVKEGEGPKLVAKIYSVMESHPMIFAKDHKYPPVEQILDNIKSGNFLIGIINREHPPETLILSGHDLHYVLAVPDPDDPNYYLITAMFTSAKDSNTVELSTTQVINKDLSETNKPQMMRFSTRIVKIHKDSLQEYPEATAYVKEYTEKGQSVMDKVIKGIEGYSEVFKNYPITEPQNFTKNELIHLAKMFYQENITDLSNQLLKLETILNRLPDEDKASLLKIYNSQKRNYFDAERKQHIVNMLPKPYKILHKIQVMLETKYKQVKKANKTVEDIIIKEPNEKFA